MKSNKSPGQKGVDASIFEVAFSEIASLFFKPRLTSCVKLVVQQSPTATAVKQIIGIASEKYNAASEIVFLDTVPKNFFAGLLKQHKNNLIEIDMESLASIMTGSYVLEEDDLHKGNIGFYITVNDQGKNKYTFFKIDHDLMFTGSIMSYKDMRLANLFYNKHSFKITAQDLDDFPDLKDSGNHYWPTRRRFIAIGPKSYTSQDERMAFASLKDDSEFKQKKWKYFLKAAIMPIVLIEKSLNCHLDPHDHIDKINMIKNSIWSRIGKLKKQMLASPQFIQYLQNNALELVLSELKLEVTTYLANLEITADAKEVIISHLENNLRTLQRCANQDLSIIQKSILLDNYSFGNIKKTLINTDIEFAMGIFDREENEIQKFKYACIVTDLIKKTNNTQHADKLLITACAKNSYLNYQSIATFEKFIQAANKIRACALPLKQQKNEIITVLQQATLSVAELKKLKQELQKKEPLVASLKFINQLRSGLWLIRKIRGVYGSTHTSSVMLHEVNAKIKNINDLRGERVTTPSFKLK